MQPPGDWEPRFYMQYLKRLQIWILLQRMGCKQSTRLMLQLVR